jgi:hypothetical protein
MKIVLRSLLLGLLLSACLERAEDQERPGYSVHVLPRGAHVADVMDDEVLTMRVANNAGATGPLVPLHTGFAAGEEVLYWDFGAQPSSVEPVWILQRSGDGGPEPIDHPPIVDSLPGDDSYSPFRAIFTIDVTSAYDGEQLTSLAAIEDAIDMGLVGEPVPTGTFVSWPIVPADFTLERRDAEPMTSRPLFGKGHRARYLPLSEPAPFERSVSSSTAYELRPQDQLALLDEAAREEDLNADGDQLDSNVIFDLSGMPTGLWSPVELTVASDYTFGTYRSDSELFATDEMGAVTPVPDAFIARSESEDTLYRPLFVTEPEGEP